MDSQETGPEIIHYPKPKTTSRSTSCARLRRLFSVLALTVAGTSTGCNAVPDAEVASQKAEIADLTQKLDQCGNLKDLQDGAIISFGTLGVRRLYRDRENRIIMDKSVAQIDQVFILWPPPQSPEAITVEGDSLKLRAANFGSYNGVQFKAEYDQSSASKDSFVIQNSMVGANSDADPTHPGNHRYVIIFERR